MIFVYLIANLIKAWVMNVYKLIFAKNVVISCDLVSGKFELNEDYLYHQDKGQLIYAIVKADNEAEALNKGGQIIKEVTEKIFGIDFIN